MYCNSAESRSSSSRSCARLWEILSQICTKLHTIAIFVSTSLHLAAPHPPASSLLLTWSPQLCCYPMSLILVLVSATACDTIIGTSCDCAHSIGRVNASYQALITHQSAGIIPSMYQNVTSCDAWFTGTGPAYWLHITLLEPALLNLSTCDALGFDTDLSVWRGDCSGLQLISCNGDSPIVMLCAPARLALITCAHAHLAQLALRSSCAHAHRAHHSTCSPRASHCHPELAAGAAGLPAVLLFPIS